MTRSHFLAATSIAAALVAATPAIALAQTREPRISVVGLLQHENVAVDGGTGGFTAGGAALVLRVSRYFSVQGELTQGSGEAHHSYEGVFTTIAPPGSSYTELERLGVVLRRDRTWRAGGGGAFMVTAHTPVSQKLGAAFSVGLAGRTLEHIDRRTLIRLPEGWDPSKSTGEGEERYSRGRGGLMAGVAIPVRLTSHFTIAPELRFAATIADENYSVVTIGMRGGWSF